VLRGRDTFVVAPSSELSVKKFGTVGDKLDSGTIRSAVLGAGNNGVAAWKVMEIVTAADEYVDAKG